MISVICVYNDREILDKWLHKSLENQNTSYELILVDNVYGKYKSAAEALNYGAQDAKSDYLMFVHQDFEFDSNTWLEEATKTLNSLENLGIAGIAGKYDKNLISNITTGYPPILASSIPIEKPEQVQTLDECLIIIPKKIFNKIRFDEVVCDDWHLYATDYCLTVKKEGYDAYVLPLGGYHVSPGYSFSENGYYSTLKKLIKKHEHDYKWIYTSTGSWSTVYPLFFQILYQKMYYWLLDKRTSNKWLFK